jgi:ProP effector
MGFEQLAELKKQLAMQAKAKPAAKAPKEELKTAPTKAPRPEPEQKARRAPPPAHAKSAKPANPAKPVDPVVRTIGKLQKRFPNAFPKNPAPKLPLKVGIFEDLAAHATELALTEAELRDAIKTWCRGSRYWACLVEGAARVDLAGSAAGSVSATEAAGAQRLKAHRSAKAAPKPQTPDTVAPPAGEAEATAEVKAEAPAEAKPEAESGPVAG